MATLKEKLEAIKLDKDTNLLPEHLKAGVTCLGVEGKFEGVSKEIPVKLFSSEEEMQADTAAKQDDLAIIYRNELGILEVGQTYNSLYLPKTITLNTAITSTTNIFFSTGTTMTATHFVRLTSTTIKFYKKSGFSGAVVNTVSYTSTDGITYNRADNLSEVLTIEEIYQNEYSSITVQETNANILQQMFFVPISYFGGIYIYTKDGYINARTQFKITPEYVFEKDFFGANGIEKGTLQENSNLTEGEILIKSQLWDKINELTPEEANTDFGSLFKGYTGKSIPMIDTSNIVQMGYMFQNCPNLKTIPALNTSKVAYMSYMFQNCVSLEEVPFLETNHVGTMTNMFNGCVKLNKVQLSNTSNVTNMEKMFTGCSSLTEISPLDASNVTSMTYMFDGCSALPEVSLTGGSKVTSMEYVFNGCSSLIKAPQLDMNNVIKASYMFANCSSLTEISQLDFSGMKMVSSMFTGCTELTTVGGFLNYGKAFTQAVAGYTYYDLRLSDCTKLTHDSLMNIINNLYDLRLSYDVANGGTLYKQDLILGNTNLAKLTAEEIAIATNKGWIVS